jgi:hypothetical protein
MLPHFVSTVVLCKTVVIVSTGWIFMKFYVGREGAQVFNNYGVKSQIWLKYDKNIRHTA